MIQKIRETKEKKGGGEDNKKKKEKKEMCLPDLSCDIQNDMHMR